MLALMVWQLVRGRRLGALLSGLVGVGALWWYLATDTIPDAFTEMTPYVTTLLVLALFSQRLRMPAADGLPYRRGEAG
jgi:general nucleoside transport system permease protein